MPLVRHLELPSLNLPGALSLEQATRQDIRELHIGFLNMMPDAALQVTERQFLKLVGYCNQIAQFYVHPFSLPGLPRGPEAEQYIARHYRSFEQLKTEGLDALIVTGANVTRPDLRQEPFWEPLMEVLAWATRRVTSVWCSCLASHAVLEHLYGIRRQPLPAKRWGVFRHRKARLEHPLLHDINTRFDVPHSRWNTVSAERLRQCGVTPLIVDEHDEVHLAVSPDGLRVVYSQGHPEYDRNSLLKEYKREVLRYQAGELAHPPPYPEGYFPPPAEALADRYRRGELETFPEAELEDLLDNTWGDTGKAVFNNWLGLVYQLTHLERHRPFVEGVDPEDPIGWLNAEAA